MFRDRYGNSVSTGSASAMDAYVAGVDLLLSANAGAIETLQNAVAHDPEFVAAHVALARALQSYARGAAAKTSIGEALRLALSNTVSTREKSQAQAMSLVIEGRSVEALAAVRAHLQQWPRDAVVLHPATGVFGLVGFSGRAGREAELLTLLSGLEAHYGDDWWFDSALAFAEIECGRVAQGLARVDRSLAKAPRNANGAHIKAHAHYEAGERQAGLAYLEGWLPGYGRESLLHCHLNWHAALWALEAGDAARAWSIYDGSLQPDATWGPPINVLTDAASFLFRAELAGVAPRPDEWRRISAYATRMFPAPGMAFADVHAALAHAMAGEGERLAPIVEGQQGAAADVVRPLAAGFSAVARGDWAGTIDALQPLIGVHERIGGSRAQRDIIEQTLTLALIKCGRDAEARAVIARRGRPGSGRPN